MGTRGKRGRSKSCSPRCHFQLPTLDREATHISRESEIDNDRLYAHWNLLSPHLDHPNQVVKWPPLLSKIEQEARVAWEEYSEDNPEPLDFFIRERLGLIAK